MAKIHIRERKEDCKQGDYYRDEYKRYWKVNRLETTWGSFYATPKVEAAKDPTENLPRVEGAGGFNRETLVLCRVEDMREGCPRTGSESDATTALRNAKSGQYSMEPMPGHRGGYSAQYGKLYGFCRPGDVMAFDDQLTVTTLSNKRSDKLDIKTVKHGQMFQLDSGELVYAVVEDGTKFPTGRGWFCTAGINPPPNHAAMWQVDPYSNTPYGNRGRLQKSDYPVVLVTGAVPSSIEGIARLAAAEKAIEVQVDTDDAGTFILWSPISTLPVTKQYAGRKQATAVAVKMAEANPGQKFIVAKLFEEFVVEKPVAPTLKRAKL